MWNWACFFSFSRKMTKTVWRYLEYHSDSYHGFVPVVQRSSHWFQVMLLSLIKASKINLYTCNLRRGFSFSAVSSLSVKPACRVRSVKAACWSSRLHCVLQLIQFSVFVAETTLERHPFHSSHTLMRHWFVLYFNRKMCIHLEKHDICCGLVDSRHDAVTWYQLWRLCWVQGPFGRTC